MAKKQGEAREWFRVTRNDATAIDIDIYGDIGETTDWWSGEKKGLGAKSFLDTLREARGKAVNLHVNSAGGNVVDAYAMMTAIANHDGKVTAYIDGIAASAASYLVAAADEVVMSSVAWMMIHDATLLCWGGADDLRDAADYLDKTNRHIAEIYAKRSGKRSLADFVAAMAETTWFTPEEALEWGLVDTIEEAVAAAACVTADKSTLGSVPPAAAGALQERVPGAVAGTVEAFDASAAAALVAEHVREAMGLGDTSENIPSDEGGDGAQEPPSAKDRIVSVGGRPYIVKERTIDEH